MRLRTRLALALGALAAVTGLVVAVSGYRITGDRLDAELDRSLAAAAARVAGAGGPVAPLWCDHEASEGRRFDPRREARNVPPGVLVQCLAADGSVQRVAGDEGFPLAGIDREVARGERGYAPPHSVSDDGERFRVVSVAGMGVTLAFARSTDENDNVLTALAWRYLWLVLAAAVVAAAAGAWIAHRVARPIVQLAGTAEEVAQSGRVDLEVPRAGASETTHDETVRLARSFATMLAALRASREQQQRLVQDAGHELRTPLTSLRANIDTLGRYPDLDPAQREQVLADVAAELRELTDLTNEIVLLAVDAGDDEPEHEVDLAAVVEGCCDRLRRRSGRTVELAVGAPRPALMVGRARELQRVVDNLLDNATKFSPESTPVEVRLDRVADAADATCWRVQVRDHGPGIDAADAPHLFERFYRATRDRATPGSGLGLAIVDDIVRRHGGTAAVANHPEGGALVTIELPATPPAVP